MQSQDAQVPHETQAKDAALPVVAETIAANEETADKKTANKKVRVRKDTKDKAPLTAAESATKLQNLQGKLVNEVEPFLRSFQAAVAAINTDAAYDVKQTNDAYVMDVEATVKHWSNLLTNRPNYQPDTWKAGVVKGEIEDVWTDPSDYEYKERQTAPTAPMTERRTVTDEEINVGEPIGPRN